MCSVISVIKSNPTRPVRPITQHIDRAVINWIRKLCDQVKTDVTQWVLSNLCDSVEFY